MAVLRTMVIIAILLMGWLAVRSETFASGAHPAGIMGLQPTASSQGAP